MTPRPVRLPDKMLDDGQNPGETNGMEIALPPEWEKRIADKVAGGEFPKAEEVVREGRRLFAQEEHLAGVRAKI